jgi:hypothetical protein
MKQVTERRYNALFKKLVHNPISSVRISLFGNILIQLITYNLSSLLLRIETPITKGE